jgi:glycine cleavage system transcriptional repressor
MRTFVLALTGADRPGIVATVTGVLAPHGVNLEDAEMAILRGHFAVMLVLSAPDGLDAGALRAELEQEAAAIPLETVTLTEVPALAAAPEPTHAITVYGADHPGIVHAVTIALAAEGANVVGLSTRVAGDIYVMLLEVSLTDEAAVERALEQVAEVQGVDVSLRALDADVL